MIVLIDYLCAHLFDLFVDNFGQCSTFNELSVIFFLGLKESKTISLANNPNKFLVFYYSIGKQFFFP